MMDFYNTYIIVVIALSLCVVLALIRVLRGPTAPDRVVGVDTINTIVIVSMVAFGAAFKEVIYIDFLNQFYILKLIIFLMR